MTIWEGLIIYAIFVFTLVACNVMTNESHIKTLQKDIDRMKKRKK